MIKLSNSKLVLVFMRLLIILVIAKMISLVIGVFLPYSGVESAEIENYQPRYQRVDFKDMLTYKAKVKTIVKDKKPDNGISITSMILKGLYGTKSEGFIIVAMKSNPKKTTIVSIGESYKGYRLEAIFTKSVRFRKNQTEFILYLGKRDKFDKVVTKPSKKQSSDEVQAEVSRSDISYYAKNPKEIWKNISIREIRDGKKIKGFRIDRINANSVFARLGLKKGDLIVKVNNMKIKSYREALSVYKNIDMLDSVQIIVLRDNQEVELVYEID